MRTRGELLSPERDGFSMDSTGSMHREKLERKRVVKPSFLKQEGRILPLQMRDVATLPLNCFLVQLKHSMQLLYNH